MFGSDVVNSLLYDLFSDDEVITLIVGDRIHGIDIAPGDLPALLFHPSSSSYDGSIGGDPAVEMLTYQVRLICEGTSIMPILSAAQRQMALLDPGVATHTITLDEQVYHVTFTVTGESIPTTVFESGMYYRLLGNTYDVLVAKG